MSEEIRKKLGEAAVKAAKAVGYVGAGNLFHTYLFITIFEFIF